MGGTERNRRVKLMRDVSEGQGRQEGEEGVTHSWPNAQSNRFRLASCRLSSLQRKSGGRQEKKKDGRGVYAYE